VVRHDRVDDQTGQRRKVFYCPLKKNRLVDDTSGEKPYTAIENLSWTAEEIQRGKTVKVKKFAAATHLKMFRVTVSTNRTDYIVTNDLTQSDTNDAQEVSGQRWKIEQFHREAKQITGVEQCQCRLNRSQRNYIASALLVWLVFKELADKAAQTVNQLKHGLLSDYLKQQLRNPAIAFRTTISYAPENERQYRSRKRKSASLIVPFFRRFPKRSI